MIGVGGLVTAADGVSQWCGNSRVSCCVQGWRLAAGGRAAVHGVWGEAGGWRGGGDVGAGGGEWGWSSSWQS